MKKILAALLLLALVFAGAAAQEFELSGELKVDADLFSVTTTKYSDEDKLQRIAPEADWRIVDLNSVNWEDTKITFKVTADNYGGTFQIGAPTGDGTLGTALPNAVASLLRQIEIWVQPLPFLKLSMANGDTPWRAVERYKGDIDSYDIPYGTQGFYLNNTLAGGQGYIDEFKNGLKADIIIGEVATVEALLGVNQPLWLATGKASDFVQSPWLSSATFSVGATLGNGGGGYDTTVAGFDPFDETDVTTLGISDQIWDYVGYNGSASAATDLLFKPKAGLLSVMGDKNISPYGRLAPNYGIRVTIPVADIGKFNLTYRLGIMDKVGVLDGTVADPKTEGYTTAVNTFGIFADVSDLFAARDLPLGLVVGYTGYFDSGEKVSDVKNPGKLTDAKATYVSGIDLRLTYAIIPDTFTLALHNNATFYTLKFDKDWQFKDYYKSDADGYSVANEEDYTDFQLFNALGAKYVVVPEAFAVNLELANYLHTEGYYVKSNGKDKGDGRYTDTFSGKLTAILNVAENAELDAGLSLSVTTATISDDDGKALTSTKTKFAIPVSISVKF